MGREGLPRFLGDSSTPVPRAEERCPPPPLRWRAWRQVRPRDNTFFWYPGESAWFTPFVGGSSEFIQNNARLLDARTSFFYFAAGITPAMAVKIVGGGSQYAVATVDADRNYLDGSKTYRLHLPPNVPVKTFWSLIPYNT